MPRIDPEDRRDTRDIWIRIGAGLLDQMTRASLASNRDRSAWAERVLANAVDKGLPQQLDAKLLIAALQRDQRALLRVDTNIANRVIDRAFELGLTLTDFVLISMIGAVRT
jgi:hypothetical protein